MHGIDRVQMIDHAGDEKGKSRIVLRNQVENHPRGQRPEIHEEDHDYGSQCEVSAKKFHVFSRQYADPYTELI